MDRPILSRETVARLITDILIAEGEYCTFDVTEFICEDSCHSVSNYKVKTKENTIIKKDPLLRERKFSFLIARSRETGNFHIAISNLD